MKIQPPFFLILAMLLVSATVLACFVPAAFAEDLPEIRIGLIGSFTGSFASSGQDSREGFEIARQHFAPRDMLQGRKLKFVYADSKGLPKVGVSEFTKLANIDQVHAVIVTRSQIAMPLNPLSLREKIPLLGIAGHPNYVRDNKFAFRFWPSTEIEGSAVAELARESNHKSLAVITREDEWTLSLSEEADKTFKRLGGEVVYNESVHGDELDLRSVITQVKLANPDAIFVNLGVDQIGLFVRNAREQGIKAQLYSNTWGQKEEVIQSAGEENIEGLIVVELDTAKPKFLDALERSFGHRNANAVTYTCYAALSFLLDTLSKHAKIQDRASFHNYLAAEKSVELLDETITIRKREALFDIAVKEVRAGKVTQISLRQVGRNR